jgi:hypothetical protein
LLLGRNAEKDGLVVVFCLIFVVCQISYGRLLVLLLDMFLHVRHQRFRGALDLGGIQLVWRAICDFCGEWRIDCRLLLLSYGL